MHYELKAMVMVGLSPLEALQSATINPARFFNMEHEQGSVAVGKIANLVLLDADPLVDINNTRRINVVIAKGRVFDRGALNGLLKDMVEE